MAKARHNRTGQLVLGLVLVVVGVGMMLERAWGLDLWDQIWRLWPLALIAIGIKLLVDQYQESKREGPR